MSIENTVDVGNEYCRRLTDRYESQTGNEYNAVDFRSKYLCALDNSEAWQDNDLRIVLDFSNVDKLGPGFANEAFAYFAQYAKDPEDILSHIVILNASKVKYIIILTELESAFS
jgi:hypothetical protein